MTARLFSEAPQGLRRLVLGGFWLAIGGLLLSFWASAGLYACGADNKAHSPRGPLCADQHCASVLNDDCKRTNEASTRLKNANHALNELRNKAPEGSLESAMSRPAVDYLESITKNPAPNGNERFELWRWAGILIFVVACSGSAAHLLHQLQSAGLRPRDDTLPKWHWPFVFMLAWSNLINVGGTLLHDLLMKAPVTWQSFCNDWLAWTVERFIILGASCSLGFAFAALWGLGNLERDRHIDLSALKLDAADGACGMRSYVSILQFWCIFTPILLVLPAFGWIATQARKPDFDSSFALVWIVAIVPMLYGVVRLVRRAQKLRSAYQTCVEKLGSFTMQQEAKIPPDPTTPLLGADGWTPITGGLALLGSLWAIIDWSGVGRALHNLGW